MSSAKLLIASIIVILVLWLLYAKWGYVKYYYSHTFPRYFGMSKKPASVVIPAASPDQAAALQTIHNDYTVRYEFLKELNARIKKFNTTMSHGMKMTKALPYFYREKSYFAREIAECLKRDGGRMEVAKDKYNSVTETNIKLLTLFTPDVAKTIKETYALDRNLVTLFQNPEVGGDGIAYLANATDKVESTGGNAPFVQSVSINGVVIF